MQYSAAIFDMDGLLIDSEPLWQEAGIETLAGFGISLTLDQYHTSTGLRTEEWVAHWFRQYQVSPSDAPAAVQVIIRKAIEKIAANGIALPGAVDILDYFNKQNIKTGLATSSPMSLVDVVVDKLKIRNQFQVFTSAEHLPYGKPHPMVFLECAKALNVFPEECIVFEDSFNGMIAAKAAKMKCVVVPAPEQAGLPKWGAADLKLNSLNEFAENRMRAF